MKKRNNILKTVATALAVLGLASADSAAQVAGPAPTTSSAFRMYNSGSNWITIAASPTAGTGTYLWPTVGTGVLKVTAAGSTGTMSIGQITAADLQLTQNSMFVGGPGNTAIELPAGTNNQVLQIVGGVPTWSTINLLPNGGGNGQTLYWDGDSWESTNSVNVDITTGEVTINNDLAVTGDVTLQNGVINNNELENSDITVNAGTGLSGGGTVALGGSITLNNDGILDVVGTTNQVNVVKAAGVATLSTPQDIHTDAVPTFDGITLDNLSLTAGPLTNENVLIVDPAGNVTETSPNNIVGAATLPLNNIYVGDASNHPAAVAPGTNGQVLQISGSTPTWQTINLLPNGGGVGQTLYWDGDSWESNNTLNVNPTTGDVTANGDLTVSTGNDVVLPNGVINNNELENSDITVNAGTGLSGGGTVALGGSITLNNDGILDVVGTTNQVNVVKAAGVATLSTPQDIHTDAVPTFDGITLDNLSLTAGPLTNENVLIVDPAGNVTETSPDNIVGAATLPQNNIYVGDASNHPAAVAAGSNGDVLTVIGGTPTWSTPTGTIAAKGQVTGTGTWTYTVNPSITINASDIIMVTMTSTAGLQVTHVVNNITAGTFDVEFPVNIGGTETFHWMIIQ